MKSSQKFSMPTPIFGEKAILLGKALIIADLHLGIESELKKHGIKIPQQSEKIKNKIIELLQKTKAEKLFILGDLKHEIGIKNMRESFKEEIRSFIADISNFAEIYIAKGNHDGRIEEILQDKCIIKEHFSYENCILTHGHAWIRKRKIEEEFLILAHAHACISFKDDFGRKFLEKIWIKTKLSEKARKKHDFENEVKVIIMPAFNELIYGTPVNESVGNELLGVYLASAVELSSAEIYSLDGIFLGKLSELKLMN